MNTLEPGQVYEITDAYIGKDKKLFTRVIIYRLTEKQLRERKKKQVYTESKKGITYSEKKQTIGWYEHLCYQYTFGINLRN